MPPLPEPAGCQNVLGQLKCYLGIVSSDDLPATTVVGPDRFSLSDSSALQKEHELLTAVFEAVIGTNDYYHPNLNNFAISQTWSALAPQDRGKLLLAAAERYVGALLPQAIDYQEQQHWQSRRAATAITGQLAQLPILLDRAAAFDLMLYSSARPTFDRTVCEALNSQLICQAEQEAATTPLTEGERYVLWLFRASLIRGPQLDSPGEDVLRVTRLIGDRAAFCLAPGEAWADAVNADFSAMNATTRRQWAALFAHALSATAARPTAKWLKTGESLAKELGGDDVPQALAKWFPLVERGQTIRKLGQYSGDTRGASNVMHEENATCLRGLLWLVQVLPQANELARAITAVALSA